MIPPRRPRPLAALALLALAGTAVRADDAPPAPSPAPPSAAGRRVRAPTELPLRVGKPVVGAVDAADERGVDVLVEGVMQRIPWERLAPLGVFRARASLAPPDDGAARLALAELAADLGLFADARREYEKAAGLRAISPEAYARAVADAEARAVKTGLAEVARAADAGDTDGALALLRALTIDFGAAIDPRRVNALLAAVAAKVEARAAEQRVLAAEDARLAEESARKKEILVRTASARRDRATGDRLGADARAQMPKGVVSRVRRFSDEADDAYGAARRGLGRLRRLVGREGPDREAWLAELDGLDRAQFRLLFDAARFFWDARVYATAEDFAERASYVDPVDPGLLELRERIRGQRIRFRASDVTNARPTVR